MGNLPMSRHSFVVRASCLPVAQLSPVSPSPDPRCRGNAGAGRKGGCPNWGCGSKWGSGVWPSLGVGRLARQVRRLDDTDILVCGCPSLTQTLLSVVKAQAEMTVLPWAIAQSSCPPARRDGDSCKPFADGLRPSKTLAMALTSRVATIPVGRPFKNEHPRGSRHIYDSPRYYPPSPSL